jgi:predicted  nucleic acid-binding Zn-ribbon protein
VLEGLEQLIELAQLDEELAAFESEAAELPRSRERIAAEREGGETRLADAQQALKDAEVSQRQFEAALRDQETLLEKLEGQQFQVKSNNAYTALLHEMEAAKGAISAAETCILEGMEALESASESLATAESEVARIRSQSDEEERTIEARAIEVKAATERAQAQREQLGPQIGRELLGQYERVAKNRRPAVIVLTSEMCGGCRVGIPPQQFIEVRRAEKIMHCGTCNRILLHEDMLSSGV